MQNYLKKGVHIENSKQRSQKLSNEQMNSTSHEATNHNLNATPIQQNLELSVATWHLTNALESIPYLKLKTSQCKWFFKRKSGICQNGTFSGLHSVKKLFSERNISLDSPGSSTYYCHDIREEDLRVSKIYFWRGERYGLGSIFSN